MSKINSPNKWIKRYIDKFSKEMLPIAKNTDSPYPSYIYNIMKFFIIEN